MAYRTIMQRCVGEPVIDSLLVSGGLYPGMLVERTSTSGQVQAHSTGGGCAACMILLENEDYGKEVTDVYTTANKVRVWHPRSGDQAAVLVYSGEVCVIGYYLESQGDGTFRVVDTDTSAKTVIPQSVLFQCLETSTPSGNGLVLAERI
jgi:hypothetical protein